MVASRYDENFIDSGMNIMYYRSYLCVKRKKEKADESAGLGGVDQIRLNEIIAGWGVRLYYCFTDFIG